MANIPLISVAIPTYNREEVLIDTIENALYNQSLKDIELIIIDQSLSHTVEVQKKLDSIKDSRLRYFKTSPPSVTAARNFALNLATTPYIIFLDDDVNLDNNIFKEFYTTFKSMPEVSALAGRVMQKGFPILDQILEFDDLAISHGGFTSKHSGFTNAFPGGNCALRVKEALLAGGFDTRYKKNAFREENDLSMRLSRLGYKIYFQPKAKLTHLAAPYGGNRVKTHIYDNFSFYPNELFFTLRFAKRGKKLKALRAKYHEYCFTTGRKKTATRKMYYIFGIIVALYRMIYTKQITSQEIL
jgi:glycosyltransferase involved in cell wall biosynthesis